VLCGGESGSSKNESVGIDGGQPLCEVVATMDGHGTCMLACMIRNYDRKPLTEEESVAIWCTRPGRLERSPNARTSAAHDRGGSSTLSDFILDHPNIPTPMLLQARPNLSAAARLRAPILPTPLYFGFTPTPFLPDRTMIRL
jgi:hypothetical protein